LAFTAAWHAVVAGNALQRVLHVRPWSSPSRSSARARSACALSSVLSNAGTADTLTVSSPNGSTS
jgi:hypothetical protein